jgi:hypothetical protein
MNRSLRFIVPSVEEGGAGWYSVPTPMLQPSPLRRRIFGLENEYGLIFSPNGRVYLPMEKVLGYIFEGLIPNSWPSNAFLANGARFYQDTGCHPEYSTPRRQHSRSYP